MVKNDPKKMKSFQDRINEVSRGGWIRAGVWSALYIAFVIWVAWGDWKSLGWLSTTLGGGSISLPPTPP